MSQTIIEKLLKGAEVEWKPLGEIVKIKTGALVNKNTIQNNPGVYPVINSGKEPLGFIKYWNTECDPIGITTRGAGVGSVTWQEGRYFRGNLNYSVTIKDNKKLLVRYLFYSLISHQKNIQNLATYTAIPALNAVELKKLRVPIPPLSVQKEIVRILDAITAHTAELTAELYERKKQYNYYLNKLLTFSDDEVEWKPLGEVGELIRGNGLQKKDLIESGVPAIHYGQIYTYYGLFAETTKSYVSHDLAKRLKKAQCGDILIAGTSENVEDVMKPVGWLGGLIVFSGDMFVFRPNCDVDTKYLTYLLTTKYFFDYKKKHVKGTKVIRMNTEKFLEFLVPLPTPLYQKRIVSILDRFDALATSISEGLPREIELRNKQYEYYRDQLLNFPKPGNDAIKHSSTNL